MQAIDNTKNEPHDLYRQFNKDNILLYIGISINALLRLSSGHRPNSGWYDEIATMTIEKYPSKEEALEAENKAIATENPLYNRTQYRTENMDEETKTKTKKTHNTRYVGVVYKKNKKKTYNGKPDRYYIIRYRYKKAYITEAVGWSSAGVTAKHASTLRGKVVQNIREGKYPKSLNQIRELSENGYIQAERNQKILKQEEEKKFEEFLLTLKHKENESDIRPVMISRALVGDLFIGLSPKTLANLNSQALGPTGYKVGGRKVFYLIDDLKEWAMKKEIKTYNGI